MSPLVFSLKFTPFGKRMVSATAPGMIAPPKGGVAVTMELVATKAACSALWMAVATLSASVGDSRAPRGERHGQHRCNEMLSRA